MYTIRNARHVTFVVHVDTCIGTYLVQLYQPIEGLRMGIGRVVGDNYVESNYV
jgi:hypothetical protein